MRENRKTGHERGKKESQVWNATKREKKDVTDATLCSGKTTPRRSFT